MLHGIQARFCDDEITPPFVGYTEGRLWNGFECPHFALSEFTRVLDLLIAWGNEKSYVVADDRTVHVFGGDGDGDYYMSMSAVLCATVNGDQWLFDCGGAWTFVDAAAEAA